MDVFRTSPQQRLVWARWKAGSAGAEQRSIPVDANVSALRSAVQHSLEVCEVLRTTVNEVDGIPVQTIHDPWVVEFPILRVGPVEDGLATCLASERDQLGLPSECPNIRFSLIEGPGALTLVITASPLVADHIALDHLATQLAEGTDGRHSDMLQYADVTEWLWEQVGDEGPDTVGFGAPVETMVDRCDLDIDPLPGVDSEERRRTIEPTIAAGVAAMAWRHGASTLHAIVPGRGHPDLKGAIGPFSFLADLRLKPRSNETFEDLVLRVESALETAVVACAPERPLSRGAVAIVVERYETGTCEWLDAHGAGVVVCRTSHDPMQPSIEIRLAGPAAWGAGDLRRTVEAGRADPHTRVSDLPTLAPAEAASLHEAAIGPTVRGSGSLLGDLRQRAISEPDAPALEHDGTTTSLGELWAQAGRVSMELRASKISRGAIVAIQLPRSVDAIASMIGVWRFGAAFIPIEEAWPSTRIEKVLATSGASAVVRQSPDGLLVCVPRHPIVELAEAVPAGEAPDPVGTAPAYAIATSGTTGEPKVVCVPHHALANRMRWGSDEYPLHREDRVLHHTSLGFDFSLWEIFGPLLDGARIVITPVSEGDWHEADFSSTRATVAHLTPSHLRSVLHAPGGFRFLGALRVLFMGGEALPADLAAEVRNCTNATIWNQYGPAEAAIDATFHRLVGDEAGPTVPIGRAVGGAVVQVVDSAGVVCPSGVSGEVVIGGAGLALGYLGMPAATAERFVPDPSGPPGSRRYRTGDVAHRDDHGSLVFEGRSDDQVKVRGMRVEPEEVSAVLRRHPGVRDAAVVGRVDGSGSTQLVGYVVGEVVPAEVRRFAGEVLPEFMVPGRVVVVGSLPRTANGKLDRASLPVPGSGRPAVGSVLVAPRSPVEEAVAAIWCEVLGLDEVGVEDDFFELGGHSLVATRVLARIRERLLASISARDLFGEPTVAALADRVVLATQGGPNEAAETAAAWLRHRAQGKG